MIHIEITCDHIDQPRARDAKAPCDSARGMSITVPPTGVMDDAVRAAKRIAKQRGWTRLPIPALGRRQGFVCPNCRKRYDGKI